MKKTNGPGPVSSRINISKMDYEYCLEVKFLMTHETKYYGIFIHWVADLLQGPENGESADRLKHHRIS